MKNLLKSLQTPTFLITLFIILTTTFANCQYASIDVFSSLISYWDNPADSNNSVITSTNHIRANTAEEELLTQERDYEVKLKSLKSMITNQYETSDWVEARKSLFNFFEFVKTDDQDYDYFQYLYGSTCINMEDYATALEVLSKLLTDRILEPKVRHDVEFDLALVTMLVNKEDSIRLFTSIAQNFDSPYHRDAKSIIERY